ncbi:MAG: leucyl aminopeptidase family protein [Bacteroidales bacterium]|nr:leucyl aminopeptidase family protein [Bacteroidales bacterium]
MYTNVQKIKSLDKTSSVLYLVKSFDELNANVFSYEELTYIEGQSKNNKKTSFSFNRYNRWDFVEIVKEKDNHFYFLEQLRVAADKFVGLLNENKIESIGIHTLSFSAEESLAFTEGMVLANYQFNKYKTEKETKRNTLQTVFITDQSLDQEEIDQLNIVAEATLIARTLVNEPVNYMNAPQLAKEIEMLAKDAGAKVEILGKSKIEALKMGGLLAVNKGSIDPPTFSIFEWKPENAINKKPFVFVGKGVVYDTGGLNIKTGTYMNNMKADMGGAAAVAGSVFAIAKAKLPIYVIGLIPATDNRLNNNAYVSGDIIKMFNGMTVEVLNTDAEGRMILADALAYAQKYDPALVIDLATLTGAAANAIGKYGIVAMGSKSKTYMNTLKISGEQTGERLVEFPFWEEYEELLKSDIADMTNLGAGGEGGAITAGKFLEKFTKYPYIHLDIAGPALVEKRFNYRGVGGTGVGVRLLFDFAKKQVSK